MYSIVRKGNHFEILDCYGRFVQSADTYAEAAYVKSTLY